MALILSLETSTSICSVALHEETRLLADAEIHQEQSHASQLALLVQEVLQKAETSSKQIAAVAVAAGPGSYTGLRIGTSTAKGFCYSLNIPLIAIPTLDILAFEGIEKIQEINALYVPMIDAKRMEVYCQVVDAKQNIKVPVDAAIISENSFRELLQSNKMFFFGDGSGKCKETIQHSNAVFADNIFPRARTLGLMAASKFAKKNFEDLVNFKPFYLKEFIAKKAQSVF